MRTELTLLEKIDLYSSGKLSGQELINFEQSMASDEVLRAQVKMHTDFVRTIKRKVLRSQISAVSAAASSSGGGLSNLSIGLGSILGIGILVMATLFFNGSFSSDAENALIQGDETTELVRRGFNSDHVMPHVEDYKKYIEQPETIFSTHQQYSQEVITNDKVNVTVRLKSGGEGMKVEQSQTNKAMGNSNGQLEEADETSLSSEDHKYRNFSRKANYPGGNSAMKKFMDKNLYYPKSAEDKAIECVVRCEFHVTEDGLIAEIKAECIKMSDKDGVAYNDVKLLMNRRIMNAFIGNATHILRTMPIWEPAKNTQGNPILSVQRMYFNYDLERGCLVYQLDED